MSYRNLFVSSFVAVLLHAMWPLREVVRGWNDFAWIYVAGRSWWEGSSPYDFPRWAELWYQVPIVFTLNEE